MNKYDFGYVLQPGSTNEWAFQKVKENSHVLEFGPSIGYLTRALKERKNCRVDIVEINDEAAEKAMPYAEKAATGSVQGDIETYNWCGIFEKNAYDYLIFLDVLEHLRSPERVLERAKPYLKEDGSVLLSVPNIAHNSIIINLIRNKFEYTKLGLLDDTHIHFFTYDSLRSEVQQSGFAVVDQKPIQLGVGFNEIKNSYDQIDSQVAAVLRCRPMADLYQMLLELKKSESYQSIGEMEIQNSINTKFPAEVYVKERNDTGYSEKKCVRAYVDPHVVSADFDLSEYHEIEEIRVDPFESTCILEDLRVTVVADDRSRVLSPVRHNGICDEKTGALIFSGRDPQLFYSSGNDEIKTIHLEYRCTFFNDKLIQLYGKEKAQNNFFIKEIQKIFKLNSALEEDNKTMKTSLETLQREYGAVLNSISWRATAPFRELFRRLKK